MIAWERVSTAASYALRAMKFDASSHQTRYNTVQNLHFLSLFREYDVG